MWQYDHGVLYGRDVERERLVALIDEARHGHAGIVVLHGEPGVGKSALLEDVVADVADARVLRTQGMESETPLAFAALHRLLLPVLALLDLLPSPQARALRVAFGQEDGAPVEPFLVGVATLSMLTEAAEDRLVVVVVDDAHWLDSASANALLFAARRLHADRVVVLFAARDSDGREFHPEAMPSLVLGGLDAISVRALLAATAGRVVPVEVSDRLAAETGGNPLALIELPSALSSAQLNGTSPLPPQLLLTTGVERIFLDRCRRLPRAAQALMLVAAADDTGLRSIVQHAAAILGVDEDALEATERAGLLVVDDDSIVVRHPLVRSAIYQAATDLERRHAHRALADVLGELDDPDRPTWHRAAAAEGPDEDLVAALDRAGARAERRGGHRAAADAYQRAGELTVGVQQRCRRQFAAARNAWACGQTARTSALLATARGHAEDPLLRADIDRLRGRIEVNVGAADVAHRIFTQAAQSIAALDPDRAIEMAVAAAVAGSHGADSGAVLEPDAIVVDVTPEDAPRTRCLKQLLVSTRHAIAGDRHAAIEALHAALDSGRTLADLDLLGNLGNAALRLGDDPATRTFYGLMLSTARERGDGMSVLYALQRLAFGQFLAGQWSALRSTCEEAISLSVSVGQRAQTAAPLAWLTLLAALEGDADVDDRLADLDHLVSTHTPTGILTPSVHDLTRWARATKAAQDGDPATTLHQFGQMRQPTLCLMAAPDRIDAAVRAGDRARAETWIRDLDAFAAGTDLPWAQAAADLGRALTADPTEPGRVALLFERSLAHHLRADRPYDRARTHLAYGEFLRRTRRRVDARTQLRRALHTFEDLHAAPLAARATQELRASGERARPRDPSTLLTLTPMELKVTQLVSQGLSNRDVAARCWVSPRTVAFHLRNVFTKTGVTSRGELAQLDRG